jgi:hypothetical protein
MMPDIIAQSADLKRLWEEGHSMEVVDGHLLVHQVPYVNSRKEIKLGTLLTTLSQNGGRTIKPDNHVIYFIGEFPCLKNGSPINQLFHQSGDRIMVKDIVVNHSFSNKPVGADFPDYHAKIRSYIGVISNPAKSIDDTITELTFAVRDSIDSESVFNYLDTNSTRAEIVPISAKLAKEKVGIIGVGGTGSYLLDFLAKTPVLEIHLFDGDDFIQHNAFRAPGAPSIAHFYEHLKKTDYLKGIYSNMHRFIFSHPENVDKSNVNKLEGLTFVFICMDAGPEKEEIINYLEQNDISFIDVGLGVEEDDGALFGMARVTTSLPGKRGHTKRLISFAKDADQAIYDQNIQLAELNALNASLAIIKWKKLLGFYKDHENELHSTYTIHLNETTNESFQD